MLTLYVCALLLSQTAPVAVVDISADDAIYEDVSRGYAQALSDALKQAGVMAVRVDESELPPQGCKLGPCLGEVARAKKAWAIATLDAEEVAPNKSRVVVTLMRAVNGAPLGGGRYEFVQGQKKLPRGLLDFIKQVRRLAEKEGLDGGLR